MYSKIKKLVDVCNASEVQMYWNVDTLSFIKKEFKLTEPYWQFDDGEGEGKYAKYIIYHQGSYSIIKEFKGKLIQQVHAHPSDEWYLEMQFKEEDDRIEYEIKNLELEDDLLIRYYILSSARNLVLRDHFTWFIQNNHESIRNIYKRNQNISDVLS